MERVDDISKTWQVAPGHKVPGESLQTAWSRGLQAAYIKIESSNNLTQYLKEGSPYIWLKKDLSIPKLAVEELGNFDLYLGRISMADEVWLNGEFLGSQGRDGKDFWSAWNEGRYFSLNPSILKEDGNNTLLIRIFGRGEANIAGPMVLGESRVVQEIARNDMFWNSSVNAIISVFLGIMSLYHILMWFRRKTDKENLYYGATAFFFSLYLTNFYITSVPLNGFIQIPYEFYQRIIFASLFATVYTFVSFLVSIQSMKEHPWVVLGKRIIIGMSLLIILLPIEYGMYRNQIVPMVQISLIGFLIYIMMLIIKGIIRKLPESKFLVLGTLPLLLSATYDLVVHQFLKLDNQPYLSGIGISTLFIGMLFILAYRFASYRNDLADLNTHLEEKIHERTTQLEASNIQLSQTIADLESAKSIAAKDLAMAINVQKNVLETHPPLVKDWEIAFDFKPMSGISGDFYDFYTQEGELRGLSLFDVSGHGIASGLITMIGRSVLHSQFLRNQGQKLGSIVSSANEELIKQIGNTDNYLTGIVLRFSSDKVEYVNAGHPDLLFRKAENFNVVSVSHKDHNVKGRFMGIEALAAPYHSLSFKVQPEDILLLASDCLFEGRNPQGEEYGMERVKASLRRSYGINARSLLNAIMHDFFRFVDNHPLQDDLTVIIARRRKPKEELKAEGINTTETSSDDEELELSIETV